MSHRYSMNYKNRVIIFTLLLLCNFPLQGQLLRMNDALDSLYYNGLKEGYLYNGVLHDQNFNIFYTEHNDYFFYVIPVVPGDTLFVSSGGLQSTLLFLKSKYIPSPNGYIDYIDNPGQRLTKLKNTSATIIIPAEANFLYISNTINGDKVLPTELVINGHNILDPEKNKQATYSDLNISHDLIDKLVYKDVLSPSNVFGKENGILFYDLPIICVCDNPEKTIVIGAEAHCGSKTKWVTAISHDRVKSFVTRFNYLTNEDGQIEYDNNNQPIIVPITELIYDRINDRLLSLRPPFVMRLTTMVKLGISIHFSEM